MLDELKAHLEEMLRGFRSGVAVYEEHIVEALAKLERAAAQLVTPAAPATEATNSTVPSEPAAAPTVEAPAAPSNAEGNLEPATALNSGTVTAPVTETDQAAAVAEPATATVTTDPQPAAAA